MRTDRWRKAAPKILFVLGKGHHVDRRWLHGNQMRNMRKYESEHLPWNSASRVPLRIAKKPRTSCRRMSTNCLNMRSAHTGGIVARVVYLAQDKMNLSVDACLLASFAANPISSDQACLERVVRYLYRQMYRWQSQRTSITLQTDSVGATCQNTRRSKSGSVILVGFHPVSHLCPLQTQVALSSGEAELYSSIHGIKVVVGFIIC